LLRDNVLDYGKNVTDLKERVFEIIEELLMELETAGEEIRQGWSSSYENPPTLRIYCHRLIYCKV
jgi:hypothetical protein